MRKAAIGALILTGALAGYLMNRAKSPSLPEPPKPVAVETNYLGACTDMLLADQPPQFARERVKGAWCYLGPRIVERQRLIFYRQLDGKCERTEVEPYVLGYFPDCPIYSYHMPIK